MERAIEVEIKKYLPLKYPGKCEFCEDIAFRTIKVGEVQNHYGTDFDVCEKECCKNEAMDTYLEDLRYVRTHRREFVQSESWNLREGQ